MTAAESMQQPQFTDQEGSAVSVVQMSDDRLKDAEACFHVFCCSINNQ
jgi:hypothetical protein